MSYIEKRKKLPEKVRDLLFSDDPRIEAEKACFMYGLDSSKINSVTEPIGLIFIGDYNLKDYPQQIISKLGINSQAAYGIAYQVNKKVFNLLPDYFRDSGDLLSQWEKMKMPPLISEDDALKKVIEIEPWLADSENEVQEVEKSQSRFIDPTSRKIEYVKVSIAQAMRDFPKINEQKITAGLIKSPNSPYPLQPTLKNWLEDYYREMGSGSHNIIDRGNYLFHGKNAKKLNDEDRQKLAIILKSLSEGVPVLIDREREKIVFPEMKKMESPQTVSPASDQADQAGNKANEFLFGRKPEPVSAPKEDDFHSRVFDRPETVDQKTVTDGIRPAGIAQPSAPGRVATASDFQSQPRFKIQDVSAGTPKNELGFSGEQLRKKMFEYGGGGNAPGTAKKIISQDEDSELGKIEFSSTQVTPADKASAPAPPANPPIASRRISPIGRNSNVI